MSNSGLKEKNNMIKVPFTAPTTVDGVLSQFRKTIDQLEMVRTRQIELADAKDIEAEKAIDAASAARTEASKANVAIGRLNSIFG